MADGGVRSLSSNSIGAEGAANLTSAAAERVVSLTTYNSVSGYSPPSSSTIDANRREVQQLDPLQVDDNVVVWDVSPTQRWRVQTVIDGTGLGNYSLTADDESTEVTKERWKLFRACAAGTWLASLTSGCIPPPQGCPILESGVRFLPACSSGCLTGTYGIPPNCTECPAGTRGPGGFGQNATTGCFDCEPGSLAALPGSGSCTPCPTGRYGNATGSTSEDKACPSACPAGTHGTSAGQVAASAACSPCSVGSYSAVDGASSCTACPAGARGIKAGAASLAGGCRPCSAGSYAVSASSTTCQPCARGTFGRSDRVGGANASWACPHLCPAGTVGVAEGQTELSAACDPCLQGTANPTPGQTGTGVCRSCNETHGTTAEGMAHCVLCPFGTFRNASGTCDRCPRAHVSNVLGAVDVSVCQPCPAGTFQDGQACIPCPMGTFNPAAGSAVGADDCTACQPGHVSRVTGAAQEGACTPCTPGTYANSTTHECDMCPAGTYSGSAADSITSCVRCTEDSIAPSDGLRTCMACPPGTFADSSRTQCVPCRPCAFEGQSLDCMECEVGTRPNCTSGLCEPCPAGTAGAMTAGGPVCEPCPVGMYGTAQGCTACPTGTYRLSEGGIGVSACSPCPRGTYSSAEGAKHPDICRACPPGTFNDATGASSIDNCTLCPEGTYSARLGLVSVGQCDTCPEGTSSDVLGATSAAVCQDCPSGSVSDIDDSGAQICVECPRGTWHQPASAGGNASCVPCAPGKYGTRKGATAEDLGCSPCPAGRFSEQAGAPDDSFCEACPAGTFSEAIGATSNVTCQPCGAGTFSLGAADGCQECAAGKYSDVRGASSPQDCRPCPQGTFGEAQALPAQSNCSACPAGTYGLRAGVTTEDVACGACPAGTFSPEEAAPDEGSCRACPAGTASDDTGATSNDTCSVCPAGKYSVARSVSCELCPAGTYSEAVGADSSQTCTACPQGTFGAKDGARSADEGCTPCPPGTSSAVEGVTTADACVPCEPGAYADSRGSAACSPCPPRRTTTAQGAVSHLACRCEADSYATKAVFAPTEQACDDCPARGAVCEPGRLPTAAPGFWHDPQSDVALFFPCSPAEACAGGDLYAGNMTARCALAALEALDDASVREACADVAYEGRGGPQSAAEASAWIGDPGALCTAAYAGERCSQCAAGHYRLNSACLPCPDTQWVMAAVVLLGVSVMGAAAAVIVRSGVSLAPLTIGVDFFQTLARVASIRAGWSTTAVAVLDYARVFEVDVELMAPECVVETSYTETWTAVMVLPVVCLGLLLATHAARIAVVLARRRARAARVPGFARAVASIHLRRFAGEVLLLLQVAYVQLSVKSLSAVDCTTLPNGKQALDASPNMICWEGEHWSLVGRAAVALLVYLAGVPLLFAGVLRYVARVVAAAEKRRKAQGKDPFRRLRDIAPRHLRKASLRQQVEWTASATRQELMLFATHQTASSLFERFRPAHMRWLLVIMARKVALSAVTVLQSSRPGIQLAGFAATLFVALVAQIKAHPYERVDDAGIARKLEERQASQRRRIASDRDRGRGSWHAWLRISAYGTFLDPNAMEEASLMSSLAIVLCALVYHASWTSAQEGVPVEAGALRLLDAALVCIVAGVSLYMVALVLIPLAQSCAGSSAKKEAVVSRGTGKHGADLPQSGTASPMWATARRPVARPPAGKGLPLCEARECAGEAK